MFNFGNLCWDFEYYLNYLLINEYLFTLLLLGF